MSVPDTKAELLEDWKRSREYTANVLDAMPLAKGDYKPAGDVRSFRQQALHILAVEEWFLCGMIEGDWEQRSEITTVNHPDLDAARDACRTLSALHQQRIEEMEDLEAEVPTPLSERPLPRRVLLSKLLLHEAHHRGQMIVYLRMNGVTPPTCRN